jgi:hypothetical protein
VILCSLLIKTKLITLIYLKIVLDTALSNTIHVRWVPCHHGMARPQVADGGDGLQIWRVAANILNKQSRQPTRGGLPDWGFGVG